VCNRKTFSAACLPDTSGSLKPYFCEILSSSVIPSDSRQEQQDVQPEEAEVDELETYDSIDDEGPPLPPRKYSNSELNITQAFGNAIYLDHDSQPSTTITAREGDVESLYDRIDDEECQY
jgi:hypothetical protein